MGEQFQTSKNIKFFKNQIKFTKMSDGIASPVVGTGKLNTLKKQKKLAVVIETKAGGGNWRAGGSHTPGIGQIGGIKGIGEIKGNEGIGRIGEGGTLSQQTEKRAPQPQTPNVVVNPVQGVGKEQSVEKNMESGSDAELGCRVLSDSGVNSDCIDHSAVLQSHNLEEGSLGVVKSATLIGDNPPLKNANNKWQILDKLPEFLRNKVKVPSQKIYCKG